MARVQHGPIVASASGRIGRLVIRQTRFGPVVQTAHDVPSYQTPAALAAKARFRSAQQAWSIMPSDLSDLLRAQHRRLSLGIPGPWITHCLRTFTGQLWEYRPASNPEITVHIDSIDWWGQYYRIAYTGNLPAGWGSCAYLIIHPTNGIHPEVGWHYTSWSANYLYAYRQWWEPAAHIILIPFRKPPSLGVGRGDAAPLPSS